MKLHDLLPFVSALAIGLLVGFERERSHPEPGSQAAGSRTFALVAVAGTAAAATATWVVAAGLLAVGALLVVGYRRTSRDDPGVTTEMAALVTYLIGSLAWTRTGVAASLAIGVVALLSAKGPIHTLARDVVTDAEVQDAVRFLVMAFVILPLLPHREMGPYGVLDPARIWQLVVVLTGISWVGYIGTRTLGARRGLLIAGLAGGFISASATTASMARISRSTGALRGPLRGAYLASLATFAQLAGIVALADGELLARLWPALLLGGAVLAVIAFAGAPVRRRRDDVARIEPPERPIERPFGLRPVLLLAGLLTLALLVGRWVVDLVGPGGAVVASAATGLADAHAGALAAATLRHQGQIGMPSALLGVAAALSTNTVVKCILAFTVGGRRFGWRFCLGVVPAFATFGAAVAVAAARAGSPS